MRIQRMRTLKGAGVILTSVLLSACYQGDNPNDHQVVAPVNHTTIRSVSATVPRSFSALNLIAEHRGLHGGFSALWLAEDCSRMISVSDYSQVSFFSRDTDIRRSGWIEGTLNFDTDHRLTGFTLTDQGQVRDQDGDVLSGAAESLAWDGQGFLLSRDNQGNIYRYRGTEPAGRLLSSIPEMAVEQPRLGHDNAGLEAITVLPDGDVLAIWEKNDKEQPLSVGQYLKPAGQNIRFNYRAQANPGAATTLSDGSVVIGERKYLGPDQGLRYRLTRIVPDSLSQDAWAEPQVLLDHTSVDYDNFEALATCQRQGRRWLFALSDNNGDWPESWVEDKGRQRQKTLLVQFDLDALLSDATQR